MIRQAAEGSITWFSDLGLTDIPYPLPNGIKTHVRRGEVGLEIQGLVGAIPLRNGDTLQIIPKIGRVNFLRLLFKAEGFQRDLEKEYDDFVEYSLENERNIDTVVARQLFVSASEILNRSPKQGRVTRRREGLFAVGQIDVTATALNIACRKHEPVAYTIKEKTLHIPENRVITEALLRAWLTLEEADRNSFRSIYERWTARFSRSRNLEADLECVEQGFAKAQYGGARDYYRKALMLAQIILGSNGLGFSGSAEFKGDAVLLNTADIFEKYLRNIISSSYSQNGYVVTKGGIGASSLYTDGSFELYPDIVISRDGRILLIIDAKYKKPTSGDHYQMNVYLAVNGVKRGLLIAPLFSGNQIAIEEYSTIDKTVVRVVYLPMSNLSVTEDFISTVVERFAQ